MRVPYRDIVILCSNVVKPFESEINLLYVNCEFAQYNTIHYSNYVHVIRLLIIIQWWTQD